MANEAGGGGDAWIGTTVSRRFRITRRLGGGGMGDVYAAAPLDGGPEVALKLLRREFVSDGEVFARFLDEAHACQKLVHPNIVHATETGKADDGTPYIVMELIRGVPVVAYTHGGKRVPLAQAVPIVQGILSGLSAAHAHGIVHRDLKPENVLLTRNPGGEFIVKILDFGIAKVIDAANHGGPQKTRAGAILGTAQYMSPEQVRSPRDVDARADLWSVGVMFYEMVTGTDPFPAPTPYARMAAVISTEPPPIEQKDPQLAALAGFVAKALAKDRNQRFQSAQEMAHALVNAASLVPGSGRTSDVGAPSGVAPADTVITSSAASASAMRTLQSVPPGAFEIPPAISGSWADPSRLATPPTRPSAPPVAREPDRAPWVDLTLTSEKTKAPGAPWWLVAAVGVGALAVGFLLGWLTGRR